MDEKFSIRIRYPLKLSKSKKKSRNSIAQKAKEILYEIVPYEAN